MSPFRLISFAAILIFVSSRLWAAGIIIDHNDTDITVLTEEAITNAKEKLHIAYGHTSHGSQVTDGMTGLVGFANGGGKGLALPTGIFAWNNGGTGGALDLHDRAMGGDVGYYPQWYDNTVNYLENANNADVNVIMWSWCGQVDNKYSAGTLESEFLTPMTNLEAIYSKVKFVYMTGHVDHWDDAANKAANQVIRDYCQANGRILYDFADIESYDPDGVYYEFPHDNCDFYASESGPRLGNWAEIWQGNHQVGVDWYSCNAAHSKPLNANQKAYAAWAMYCEMAADVSTDGPFSMCGIPDSSGPSPTSARFAGGHATTMKPVVQASWVAGSDPTCRSDCLSLDGICETAGDELFVLEVTCPGASGSYANLGWYDPDAGQWVNAVMGNSDGGADAFFINGPYDGDLVLGHYGRDLAEGTVWAVIDHDSSFAVVDPSVGFVGDIDGNGSVNDIDLELLLSDYEPGGVNAKYGDGHLAVVLANFGSSLPEGSGVIPEPGSLTLLWIALLLLLPKCRRR